METLQAIFPARDFTLLLAILGLPLLGAIVNGLFGKRLGKEAVSLMALSAVGGSFIASVATFFMLRAAQTEGQGASFQWVGWEWLRLSLGREADSVRGGGGIDTLGLDFAFSVDALSGAMALIVTGVGFLIHLYSTQYMRQDEGYARFFAYLNLFIFSMLVLILGANLPVLFVGWEGVGLCSYLLIGFWFSEEANAAAGKKAFITNRIGDFGLLVAMALLLKYTGSLSWEGMAQAGSGLLRAVPVWHLPWLEGVESLAWLAGPHYATAATLVGLALFLGCAGKSAQIPLYVWLPDAMAGPTPVSALIHAATMVTAGVYLVCRMAGVFVLSPAAMFTMACVGACTAVLAATIALVQNDIKKVLAYSTVSQLGYMFLGVGVGAFTAGFFHVLTHAFFKACLFLGAGSVIHAMHVRIHDTEGSQDVRNMGGLAKFLPLTHWTFLASTLAIAGVPFTSGFYSKDEILVNVATSSIASPVSEGFVRFSGHEVQLFVWPAWSANFLLGMGVLGAVMTAFYMGRLYILTFLGEFRGWRIDERWRPPAEEHGHARDAHSHDSHDPHEHAHGADAHADSAAAGPIDGPLPHESPWAMTLPLAVLGGLALVAGLLWHHSIEEWLKPVFALAATHVVLPEGEGHGGVAIAAIGASVVGLGVAYWMYVAQKGAPARDLAEKLPGLHRGASHKWYVDELYDELVIGTVDFIADLCVLVDRYVVDMVIARVSSGVVAVFGHLLRLLQTGHVQAYSAFMVAGVAGLGWFFAAAHATVQTTGDRSTGHYALGAAPGLGYAYRWDADGDGKFDSEEYSPERRLEVVVPQGEVLKVQLEVRNALGRTATAVIVLGEPTEGAGDDKNGEGGGGSAEPQKVGQLSEGGSHAAAALRLAHVRAAGAAAPGVPR